MLFALVRGAVICARLGRNHSLEALPGFGELAAKMRRREHVPHEESTRATAENNSAIAIASFLI